MPTTDSMKRAIVKYQQKFDLIRFRVPKGKKKEIEDYASQHGMSVTELLNGLIDEKLNHI